MFQLEAVKLTRLKHLSGLSNPALQATLPSLSDATFWSFPLPTFWNQLTALTLTMPSRSICEDIIPETPRLQRLHLEFGLELLRVLPSFTTISSLSVNHVPIDGRNFLSAKFDMERFIERLDLYLPALSNLTCISVTFTNPLNSYEHRRLLDYTERRGIVWDKGSDPKDLFD
jgi:hypothetical protein